MKYYKLEWVYDKNIQQPAFYFINIFVQIIDSRIVKAIGYRYSGQIEKPMSWQQISYTDIGNIHNELKNNEKWHHVEISEEEFFIHCI